MTDRTPTRKSSTPSTSGTRASSLLDIAMRDAAPDRPNAYYLAKMAADLAHAANMAAINPANAGICATCGRLSRFCAGC